jgi:hypothetical protein
MMPYQKHSIVANDMSNTHANIAACFRHIGQPPQQSSVGDFLMCE